MSKHTPGPWRATLKTVTAPETEDRLALEVRIHGGNVDDNRANARLIAAAPELLEALVELLAEVEGCGASEKKARAAIAKATGVKS